MFSCSRYRHRFAVAAGATVLLLSSVATIVHAARVDASAPNAARATAPDGDILVRVVDRACQRLGEPDRQLYSSLDEAVKDTLPGEWWPPTGYGQPLYNGALKSGAIIIRTRIQYHRDVWRPYSDAAYATANVDWPGGQQTPLGCVEWQMNTILPKPVNAYQGGSYWNNPNGYDINQAVDRTTGIVVVRDTGGVIVTEWNPTVENRTVVCNYTSRDWAYCAVNALAEFLNSPWGQNQLARRLNVGASNRVEFQAEAYNARDGRYHPLGYSYWSWSNSLADGTGSDGSTWTGTHYLKAEPDNGVGFAGNENYQAYSPVMTYKVAFPQSGSFYVCVRGMGGTISDDSLHAGIDDNNDGVADASTALDMMSPWHATSWQWSNRRTGGGQATVQVSGNSFHTFKLWMREDGMRIDKIILSMTANCP